MTVRRPPSKKILPAASAEVEKFIRKGGSVPSEQSQARIKKISMNLPSQLLAEIDILRVGESGVVKSRSAWIQDAILQAATEQRRTRKE
jgi:hypothetical protein